MLRIDLKPGESVQIGGVGTITLEEKSGQVARLAFAIDRSVPVSRIKQPSPANIAASGGIAQLS